MTAPPFRPRALEDGSPHGRGAGGAHDPAATPAKIVVVRPDQVQQRDLRPWTTSTLQGAVLRWIGISAVILLTFLAAMALLITLASRVRGATPDSAHVSIPPPAHADRPQAGRSEITRPASPA